MLILTRRAGESIKIGDNITISVVEVRGHQVRLGIDAPRDVVVHREEIYELIQEQNRQAAKASPENLSELKNLWKKARGGAQKSKTSESERKGAE